MLDRELAILEVGCKVNSHYLLLEFFNTVRFFARCRSLRWDGIFVLLSVDEVSNVADSVEDGDAGDTGEMFVVGEDRSACSLRVCRNQDVLIWHLNSISGELPCEFSGFEPKPIVCGDVLHDVHERFHPFPDLRIFNTSNDFHSNHAADNDIYNVAVAGDFLRRIFSFPQNGYVDTTIYQNLPFHFHRKDGILQQRSCFHYFGWQEHHNSDIPSSSVLLR